MDTNSSLYPLKKDGEAPFGFTKLLRLASGQDVEPEFVLVEHSYSRPWNWQSESSHSHPRKTLFLSKVATPHREDIIDVVKTPPSHTTIPYELVRGKHLMSECERHVVFSKLNRAAGKDEENEMDKEDSDWEQTVNKTGWTEAQHNLFERIVKILDADRLARLTLNNSVNEPIKRRAQIDKTAGKFRHTLGRINWDMKLCQWLHTLLLQSMNTSYLAAYLDILQTLMAKIPNLVEKMLALPSVQKGPNIKALNLLLKRPWDPAVPVLTQEKASKLESLPIIIHVPSGTTTTSVPHTSRRIRFFNSQLQHLAKCISLSVTSESSDAGLILEQIICEVQARIIDCKNQYPSHPIVLLGWGVGAVLACYVSLIEKVSANVCLGFPMMDHKGGRGEPDDPLLEMRTPTLFVVGERATNMTVENLEEFRYRMTAETSLVVVSGADLMLKMIVERRARDALTQSMVDRCIVDEIGDFLTQTFSEETSNKSTASSVPSQVFSCAPSSITASSYAQSSSFTNPGLLPKVGKRDVALQRKRKLSPMSLAESASLQAPPKIIRTGTAISQTLGLKIPVGVSSVASLMKQEMKTCSSSVSLISATESEEISGVGTGDSVQKTKTFKASDVPSSVKSTFAGPTDGIVTTNPKPSISSQGPFDSSSLSSLSVPGTSLASLPMSCGSPSYATIPLGSFASLTRQRHQQMMQQSEHDNDPALTASANSFDWKYTKPSKIQQEDTDMDVDICGLSSGSSVSGGATESLSSRDNGTGGEPLSDRDSYQQEKQHPASSCASSEVSTAGHILVTSSFVSSASTVPTKAPVALKRGRPPGRTKGSTGGVRGRGREPSTSMAVLTFTGAAGNGSGVESAGKGISSLGRGVLTLSKGGTSTVRVFSASGQKMSSSPSVMTSATTDSQNEAQKQKSFLLTNISATGMGSVKGTTEKGVMTGKGQTKPVCNSDISGNDASTTPAQITATTCSSSSSSQASLNLQGISASRTVSFGSTKPTTVMLLPSSITSTSAIISAPNGTNNTTTTNTTTTITSGGLKTTKSVFGLCSASEESKVVEEVNVTDLTVPAEGSEYITCLNKTTQKGHDGTDKEKDEMVTSKSQRRDDSQDTESEESDASKPVSESKTQTALLLGTKVFPSVKSNLTFISSKALGKVFPVSDKLSVQPSLQGKSLLNTNPGCTLLKMAPKTSSIRLVRSVGTSLSSSGTLKATSSNSSSVGNIVTKTFTISNNSFKGPTNKRRMSFDSAICSVSKRSRGTSTDIMIQEPTHKDAGTTISPSLSASCTPDSTLSSLKSVTTASQSISTDESEVSNEAAPETPTNATVCPNTVSHPTSSTQTNDSIGGLLTPSNSGRPKILRQLTVNKKVSTELPTPITKIVSPPKGQMVTIPGKDAVTTNIKVTKELVTSSLTLKSSTLPLVPFQDREYVRTISAKTETETENEPSESEEKGEFEEEAKPVSLLSKEDAAPLTSSGKCDVTLSSEIESELPKLAEKETSTLLLPQSSSVLSSSEKASEHLHDNVRVSGNEGEITPRDNVPSLQPFKEESSSAPLKLDEESSISQKALCETVSTSETDKETSQSLPKSEEEESNLKTSRMSIQKPDSRDPLKLDKESSKPQKALCETVSTSETDKETSQSLSKSEEEESKLKTTRMSIQKPESRDPLKLDKESSKPQKALCETASTSETDKETSQSLSKSEEEESNLKTSRMSIQKPESRDPLKLDKEFSRPQKAICEIASTSETDKETSQSLSKSEEEESKLKTSRMSIQKRESRDPLKLDKESSIPQKARCETASTSETDKEMSQSLSKSEEEGSDVKTSRMSIQKPEIKDQSGITQKALCEIASTSESDKETSQSLSKSEEEESKGKTIRTSVQKPESRDVTKGRKHPHSLVVSSVARKEGTTICGSPNRKMKSKEEDSSPANRITRSTAKSGPAKRRLRSSF